MVTPINSRDVYLQAGTRYTDELLGREEKQGIITTYNQILQDQIVLDADATKYAITTEKLNYDGAVTALTTYLNSLTIPVPWNNTTGVTLVNRAFLNIKFNDVATFKKVLELAISAKAQVTGYLTISAVSLSANSSGVPISTTPGNGTFKVFHGSTDVTGNGPVYSLLSSSGITISINSTTGIYTLTGAAGLTGTATFRAVYNDITIDLNYTVAKSSSGTSGSDGQRGTVTVAVSGYSAWPSTPAGANAAFATTGYGSPVNRDIMTLYNSSFSETRFYDSGTWLVLTAYVNGNMLVSGTLSASKISGGILSGLEINIAAGYFRVRTTGATTAADIMGTNLFYSNEGNPTQPPIRAQSAISFSTAEAIRALGSSGAACISSVASGSSLNCHGLRSQSTVYGSSGLVGATNGKAFHAEAGTAGPFTGSHDAAILNDTNIEPGDIVIDHSCLIRGDWSNTFFEVVRSHLPNQKGAVGIYTRNLGPMAQYSLIPSLNETVVIDDFGNLHGENTNIYFSIAQDYFVGEINAIGEGQMNVCGENGNIEPGDLIVTSNIPGKGMRQSDDIVRSYTVAKAREGAVFDNPTDVKKIACIYMSG